MDPIWRRVWRWLKGAGRGLGARGRVDHRQPGKFVHYAIVQRECRQTVQRSVVFDREGMKRADYVSWLN